MKIKGFLFSFGVALFGLSLPLVTFITMEFIYHLNMQSNYAIININDDPPRETTYIFNHHIIDINETLIGEDIYQSPWKNNIGLGHIDIAIDGKQIDRFLEHPIRVDEVGLNRYFGEIAYLHVTDQRSDDTYFVIVGKKTKELIKEMPNGDIVGYVPEEKLVYAVHTLDVHGHVKSEFFHFTDRDGYQTALLNHSGVLPYRVGYYTDVLEGYPTFVFPFFYPFMTFIIGLGLVIIYFPRKKWYT